MSQAASQPSITTINTLLIANRGEIARRIINTAKEMGIRTIAVFSEVDAEAPFALEACQAAPIGPALASESYLVTERILKVARQFGADAIHPGYGFLSENAVFAKACEAAEISFIGPPASAIEAMGSKSAAKALIAKANVPLVPGYHGDDQSLDILTSEANKIGYPLLIKASAGGGGKGMRVVTSEDELNEAIAAAQREAKSAFGDDQVLLEKYLTTPRHVEIQIMFDKHGNGRYLFDRDCSVQRRHQKIIEEAPAPNIPEHIRKAMGEAAVRCGEAIGYVGAGTVEFLYDEGGQFYFMEMNTRLQVEHPVTEMITGLDLVEWQIKVAEGQTLPWAQEALTVNGHAIEARVYAEDPENDFLPATGRLHALEEPADLPQVRVDSGVSAGLDITPYYDPMLAKVIAWDTDRAQAIQRLNQALNQYRAVGVTLNTGFVQEVLQHPAFRGAQLTTHFIEKHKNDLSSCQLQIAEKALFSAVAHLLSRQQINEANGGSPWHQYQGWRVGVADWQPYSIDFGNGQTSSVALQIVHKGKVSARCEDRYWCIQWTQRPGGWAVVLQPEIDGEAKAMPPTKRLLWWGNHAGQTTIFANAESWVCSVNQSIRQESSDQDDGALHAPMHGRVTQVLCEHDQTVTAGTPLIVLEAMKMEHTLRAPADGRVLAVLCDCHQTVEAQQPLLEFEAAEADS